MIYKRSHSYAVAASKRLQLLTKIVNSLRAYIEKHKIEAAEIMVGGVSNKEFTFNVTPSLTNYKVVNSEATSTATAKLDKFEVDFSEEVEPKALSGDMLKLLDDVSESEVNESHLNIQQHNIATLYLNSRQLAMLQKSRIIWSVLAIEFPFVRASSSYPKVKDNLIEMDCSKTDLEALKTFIQKSHWVEYKEIYELLGLYGYLAEKQAVLIFKDDFYNKYINSRALIYRTETVDMNNLSKKVWMHANYPKIIGSKPEIMRWINRNELQVITKVGLPEIEVRRHQRERTLERKLKKNEATYAILYNYLFGIKLRLSALQESNRILEEMEVLLELEKKSHCHILSFTFEPNTYYEEFARTERENFKLTNFRIDIKQYQINLRNSLFRKYLYDNFYCYFSGTDDAVDCSVMIKYEKPLMEFLGLSQVVVSNHYELESPDAVAFWKNNLTLELDRKTELIGFTYEFTTTGIKVNCSSVSVYLKVCQLFDYLKKSLVVASLKVSTEHAQHALELLTAKRKDFPSVEIKLLNFSFDETVPKDLKTIRVGELMIIMQEIGQNTKKNELFQVASYFQEESRKLTNFFIFQGFTPHYRSVLEVVEVIRKARVAQHKHINMLLLEEHFEDILDVFREVYEIQPNMPRIDINIYTTRPKALHRYLQEGLKHDGSYRPEFSTLRLKGLSWYCEKLSQYFKKQFNQQKKHLLECESNTLDSLLVRLSTVPGANDYLIKNSKGLQLSTPSRSETSRLLSSCIALASRG